MKQKSNYLLKAAIALELVIAIFLLPGCNFLPDEEEELAPPLIQPVKIVYKTEPASRSTFIQQLTFSGTFTPETQKSLTFEQSGRLKAIDFSVGEEVKAGDLMMSLDSSDLAFQISIQEIEIEKSKLAVSQLKASGAGYYDLRRSQLSLKQQELQLEMMMKQFASTQIFAPINGKITYITSISIGEYINAYQIVAKVADLSSLFLVSKGDKTSDLPIGAEVTIVFEKKEYKGEVVANPSSLFNDPDESMRQAVIVKFFDGLPEQAKMGDSAKIIYIQNIHENVIILNRKDINLMNGRYFVNLLEDGVRVERDIEIGLMTSTEAEIVKGLEEGDLVIVG
jgi:macrolide-specific efflux system membrane fusion protein